MYGTTFFVQYCAPVADSQISASAGREAQLTEVRQCTGDSSHAWYFEFGVEENDAAVRDFYCNITLNQTRYTYRLAYNDGFASAYFYEIGEGFDLSQADVCFFERTEDGRYIAYDVA